MYYLHRIGIYRLSLIMTVVMILCEISLASTQCKMVVMDVHMKRCKFGVKSKRSLQKTELQRYKDKSTRRKELEYWRTQKRQLPLSARVGNIALPIVTESVNGAVKVNEYLTPRTRYYIRNPSLIEQTLGLSSGQYQPAPYPLDGDIMSFRSLQALNDNNLVPDLNIEELNELYNDIYERTTRASKQEAWKIFLETASKCCQNIDKCHKEAMRVPCLAL